MNDPRKKLDLAAARARLDGARGRDYWRSLDDLASTPEFRDMLDRECYDCEAWSIKKEDR